MEHHWSLGTRGGGGGWKAHAFSFETRPPCRLPRALASPSPLTTTTRTITSATTTTTSTRVHTRRRSWSSRTAAAVDNAAVDNANANAAAAEPAFPPPLVAERGAPLVAVGRAFYRAESVQARDLAILAASVRRRELQEDGEEEQQQLRVLDVMCGSGGRGARYLHQAGAEEVWSNDFNPQNLPTIAFNLVNALGTGGGRAVEEKGDAEKTPKDADEVEARGLASLGEAATWRVPGLTRPVYEWRSRQQGGAVARATCADAARLLSALGLRAGAAAASANADATETDDTNTTSSSSSSSSSSLFQLVDLDSFGSSDTHLVSLALPCVAYGGLLFLTSTDGFVSSGKRPERALAAYGAWTRPFPTGAPEQGIRALIGHAAREAAANSLSVEPLFSYYSFHGPVFRVMLRVTRGGNGRRRRRRTRDKDDGDTDDDDEEAAGERRQKTHARRGFDSSLFGFVGHCREHGETGKVAWGDLGCGPASFCPVCARQSSSSSSAVAAGACDVAGPMWLGPLHDRAFVEAMTAEAEGRGWLEQEEDGKRRRSKRRTGEDKDDNQEDDDKEDAAELLFRAAERDARAFYTGRLSKTNPQLPLGELLSVMREEADGRLPPLYFETSFLGRRLKRCPPRDGLIAALKEKGFAAARCQLERRALRTDATLEEVLRVAGDAFEGCETRG